MSGTHLVLPGRTVAVVQCCGLCVVEAVSPLLGKDFGVAFIQVFVDRTQQLHFCEEEASA